MSFKAGYLVEISTIQFDESTYTSWIQAMTIGNYQHPEHGEVNLTLERIQRFAANINNKVRTTDLDIDYDHKEYGGEAAGWVKRAEVRNDGLWVLVEWTKKAYQLLKDKAYRYFSPEFVDEWEHPATGAKYQDVLFGGGITNRPFLKDILPINMSEMLGSGVTQRLVEGGKSMEEQLKQLAKLFGLDEDASLDQILGAAQVTLGVPGNTDPNDPNDPDGSEEKPKDGGENKPPMAAGEQQYNEGISPELIKLAESNVSVKSLVEHIQNQNKQLAEQALILKTTEVERRVQQFKEKAATKNFAIPPVTIDAIREVFATSPSKKFTESVIHAFDKLFDLGFVPLSEKGSSRVATPGDAVKQFSEAIKAEMKADSALSYSDAVVRVSVNDPELSDSYRAAISNREE